MTKPNLKSPDPKRGKRQRRDLGAGAFLLAGACAALYVGAVGLPTAVLQAPSYVVVVVKGTLYTVAFFALRAGTSALHRARRQQRLRLSHPPRT